jgi:membrane associated rhomboid family serine protease
MNTERINYWLFADRIPVTKTLIVTNVATFIFCVLARSLGPLHHLVFDPATVLSEPWTLVTYPIVSGDGGLLYILFSCYWLWVAGGSLERSWGSGRFAIFFFQMCAVSAAAMYAGALTTGVEQPLIGLLLPLAGLTVAFGMVNPETIVLLMFVIPLKLKYLAAISAAAAFIGYAEASPLLGLFALAGCAFSYWYVRTARYSAGPVRLPERRPEVIRVHERDSLIGRLNPFRWFRRYRSKKRLRKLFEDSGLDKDDR